MQKQLPSTNAFFSVAFAISWGFWGMAIFFLQSGWKTSGQIAYLIGGAGPLVSALFLLILSRDRQAWRSFWLRAVDVRRLKPTWLILALLAAPALTLAASLLDALLGGPGLQPEKASAIIANPLSLFPLAFLLLVIGPLPEELAWRGYALERLQSRWSPLSASLILGIAWAAWHLPLFWVPGTYQADLGIGGARFWLFMLDKLPQTLWLTWVYNRSARSTLGAILFHFMVNFTGELFVLSLQAEALYILLWWLSAVCIAWRGKLQSAVPGEKPS